MGGVTGWNFDITMPGSRTHLRVTGSGDGGRRGAEGEFWELGKNRKTDQLRSMRGVQTHLDEGLHHPRLGGCCLPERGLRIPGHWAPGLGSWQPRCL